MLQDQSRALLLMGWGTIFTLALAPWIPVATGAEPPSSDRVEELRQALDLEGMRGKTLPRSDLPRYRKNLDERIKSLRTIGELRRALQLAEWRDPVHGDKSDPLTAIHKQARSRVAEQLQAAVRRVLKQPNPPRQLAAAILLAEMGADIRGADGKSVTGALGPDLVRLMQGKGPELRAAAARALGKIDPEIADPLATNPEQVIPALANLLLKGEEAVERRAAAEALGNLLRAKRRPVTGASRFELLRVATAVGLAAGPGLRLQDAEVRQLSAQAIRQATEVLHQAVRFPPPEPELPPEGTELTQEDKEEFARAHKEIDEHRAAVKLLSESLNKQVPALCAALEVDELRSRLAANQALEALAEARLSMLRAGGEIARAARLGVPRKRPSDPMPALPRAVPFLTKELSHSEVRVRLASLYVLETLEADAAGAAKAVVKALSDEDSFVRWAAVRTLGNLAPLQADEAVPGLSALLEDRKYWEDQHPPQWLTLAQDVRLATVIAIARFGPKARAALPALRRVLKPEERVEIRIAALQALVAIGGEARTALPDLVVTLSAKEARVRQEAARALGTFAPHETKVLEALRKALQDPDGQVRLAASEALLAGKED